MYLRMCAPCNYKDENSLSATVRLTLFDNCREYSAHAGIQNAINLTVNLNIYLF